MGPWCARAQTKQGLPALEEALSSLHPKLLKLATSLCGHFGQKLTHARQVSTTPLNYMSSFFLTRSHPTQTHTHWEVLPGPLPMSDTPQLEQKLFPDETEAQKWPGIPSVNSGTLSPTFSLFSLGRTSALSSIHIPNHSMEQSTMATLTKINQFMPQKATASP